ncbi:Cysteine desulfurase IscS [compost metagenome]
MGVPVELSHSSLRLTVGKDTTAADIDRVLEVVPSVVSNLRALSPHSPRDTAAIAEWVMRSPVAAS